MKGAELLCLLAATWMLITPPWKGDEPDEHKRLKSALDHPK